MPLIFPPHDSADTDGLLAVGGNLEPQTILSAYRQGIFPWPINKHLVWFSPPNRALLLFDQLKIPKTVLKDFRRKKFNFKLNTAFEQVIKNCARSKTRKTRGTWITKEIIKSYNELNKLGYCHSFECYQGELLVGGLYGLSIGKMFAAESMYFEESGASKLCLLALIACLSSQGFTWIDCQQLSPLIVKFGASEIPRNEFLLKLEYLA